MRSLLSSFLSVFFALLFLACGTPSSEAPVAVMVLVPVEKANGRHVFEPQKKQLTTLSDISKLEGSVSTFIGGARMDENSPKIDTATSLEELKQAYFPKKGGSVRAQFIEKNGVLWPADFHSWAMTTAYWNLEQAFFYFQEVYGAKDTKELLNIPTYYWLDHIPEDEKESSKDNAFYHNFRLMAVLPFKDFQTIPMSINIGVMAHEYAHFVFDTRVHRADPSSPSHSRSDPHVVGTPRFIMDAINEGLADFHAYGVTRRIGQGNPNFLAWTLDEKEAKKRDFTDRSKCGAALEHVNIYTVGTLFAASFYQAAMERNMFDEMAQYLVNAYDSDVLGKPGIRQHYIHNNAHPQNITLESVANVFLAHIDDEELRVRTCNQMLDRLEFNREALTNCPVRSVRNRECQ